MNIFFPKETNFKRISLDEINERPRRTLKWKNANYKFQREVKKLCY